MRITLCLLTLMVGCSYDPTLEADSSGTSPVASVSSSSQAPAVPNLELAEPSEFEFEAPVRLMVGDQPIAVEAPGYAAPTMADVDGDGVDDLVVGQFNSGKMSYFKNVAGKDQSPQFAKADWIKTGDSPAEVPGVW
ncbi:MAG: hypothetical protein AAF497_02065 [Planctomycetota bacterium]